MIYVNNQNFCNFSIPSYTEHTSTPIEKTVQCRTQTLIIIHRESQWIWERNGKKSFVGGPSHVLHSLSFGSQHKRLTLTALNRGSYRPDSECSTMFFRQQDKPKI
ncbi:hypothetical protein GDO78_012407 [Eleutherodactylus coqui]|uniref:Uncharacterized protein n=1 Tax=Eleutherodactylus coqui TaxID=57060 RepID=A0A8J6F1L8_ELECQ|nr:hypothetical protein GDO78_012407 [Eleutherodactylus coqui]